MMYNTSFVFFSRKLNDQLSCKKLHKDRLHAIHPLVKLVQFLDKHQKTVKSL